MVKLGYVPVIVVAPVPVKATVWSGESLVIVPLLAIEIPVPPVRTPVTLAAVKCCVTLDSVMLASGTLAHVTAEDKSFVSVYDVRNLPSRSAVTVAPPNLVSVSTPLPVSKLADVTSVS